MRVSRFQVWYSQQDWPRKIVLRLLVDFQHVESGQRGPEVRDVSETPTTIPFGDRTSAMLWLREQGYWPLGEVEFEKE